MESHGYGELAADILNLNVWVSAENAFQTAIYSWVIDLLIDLPFIILGSLQSTLYRRNSHFLAFPSHQLASPSPSPSH
jgi:hypothetical protein